MSVLELSDVDALWKVREQWLSATADALIECERPVARLFHAPGITAAWDECCEGMLFTRIERIEPKITTLRPGERPRPPTRVNVTLVLAILRCTPSLKDDGGMPDADALTVNAAEIEQDMWAALKGAEAITRPYALTGWTPLGPQGGCAGGAWAIQVELPLCSGCVSLEG